MNQTETGPSGFTETTVDEERIAIRVMIAMWSAATVAGARLIASESYFEVNGGLLHGAVTGSADAGLYYSASGNWRPPNGAFTGEPDVRNIHSLP